MLVNDLQSKQPYAWVEERCKTKRLPWRFPPIMSVKVETALVCWQRPCISHCGWQQSVLKNESLGCREYGRDLESCVERVAVRVVSESRHGARSHSGYNLDSPVILTCCCDRCGCDNSLRVCSLPGAACPSLRAVNPALSRRCREGECECAGSLPWPATHPGYRRCVLISCTECEREREREKRSRNYTELFSSPQPPPHPPPPPFRTCRIHRGRVFVPFCLGNREDFSRKSGRRVFFFNQSQKECTIFALMTNANVKDNPKSIKLPYPEPKIQSLLLF